MGKNLLTINNLKKTYTQPGGDLTVLDDVSFSLNKGEIVALMGPSGSGKSTLLHLVGLLDASSSGAITYDGQDYESLSTPQKDAFRSRNLGFIYQKHYLLPEFTAEENVLIPLLIQKMPKAQAHAKAQVLLKKVGLENRLAHRPWELSGGEQQRVAIARALVHSPSLLLADEPTGNLDEQNGNTFFSLLLELVKELNLTALIATHDQGLAKRMDRILYLHEGALRKSPLKQG
ncbi:MAG: ABC transporter ATP-binding protein [Alphaproteobacteria bacterium]